jgi:hypothetical protein
MRLVGDTDRVRGVDKLRSELDALPTEEGAMADDKAAFGRSNSASKVDVADTSSIIEEEATSEFVSLLFPPPPTLLLPLPLLTTTPMRGSSKFDVLTPKPPWPLNSESRRGSTVAFGTQGVVQ